MNLRNNECESIKDRYLGVSLSTGGQRGNIDLSTRLTAVLSIVIACFIGGSGAGSHSSAAHSYQG
jgi:hypothetical protein